MYYTKSLNDDRVEIPRPGFTSSVWQGIDNVKAKPNPRRPDAGLTDSENIMENELKIIRFANLLEQQQRVRIAQEYPNVNLNGDHFRSAIHPAKKYTRVDFGGAGKYMIVNATGEIFGIKAYGVIHRGHQYGTLDTIDQWNWSDYTGRKKSA